MDAGLDTLARAQDGLFTTAQARTLGIGERGLRRLKSEAGLQSVARSVYSVSVLPDDPTERLLVNTRAALLLYPDARPVGISSLAVGSVPVVAPRRWRADIARPVPHEVLTQLCRIRPPHDVLRPVTPGGSVWGGTIVQATLDHGHVTGVVAADRLLNVRALTRSALESAARVVTGWPRSSRVDTMLALADGRSESVGESRLRLFCVGLGLRVIPQFPIADDGGVFAYVDLLVEGTNLCLEFDGRVKYTSGEPEVLWREKRREDRVRRRGYTFERVVWADLARPAALRRRLLGAVREARRQPSP